MKPSELKPVVVFLSPKEAKERLAELTADPMGTVLATLFLLLPECTKIMKEIRRKFGLEELPEEINERLTYLGKHLERKDYKKIHKQIYSAVADLPDMKDFSEKADRLFETMSTVTDLFEPAKIVGRPKKMQWYPWPHVDLTNTLAWWAIKRVIWPVPDYFYNPRTKMQVDGVAVTLALLSPLNENAVMIKGLVAAKAASKKRGRDILARDAYYYLLKNEQAIRTYVDVASYVIEEGVLETHTFDSEEDEFNARKKLSQKIAKACQRFDQFVDKLERQL